MLSLLDAAPKATRDLADDRREAPNVTAAHPAAVARIRQEATARRSEVAVRQHSLVRASAE